jgi:pimeloyl-ACP methyl ester carboxylesterase
MFISRTMSLGAHIFLLLVPLVTPLDAAAVHAAESQDFAGLVDIGGGRKIYMECRAAGSPTVVLISGKGNGAADWSKVLDPADSARNAPLDAVGAGEGRLLESETAVLPAVSHFTRVCAYDRPGTRNEGADISTPVAQPHRVDQDVDDLQTLLAAAGEPGPYILVPHSYGGLVALLYARLHPEEVAGLVMVDAAADLIRQEASAKELAGWDASNRVPAAPEAVELLDAIEKIEVAPHLPERPAVVLSADKPWQSPAPDAHGETSGGMITFAEWLAAQDLLAASLHAAHVAETQSGHNLYLYQPGLVVDAIRKVVDEVRPSGAQGLPAGLIDIGGGRKMYVACRGVGSPTVVLVSGLRASAEDWSISDKSAPAVFPEVAKFTRVCAYDRPGTPVDDKPSRSDPVPQPTTAGDAVADLHALLSAAGEVGPYVLVAHSYGGLIGRLYASTYPDDITGLVLVDALSVGLQDAETPEQWAIQRKLIEGDVREGVAQYPALERIDVDRSFDQIRAAPPLRQLPLIVLSADRPWGPQIPSMIAEGKLPTDVPPDFGYVTDAAQNQAQERLAQLVPNAKHITNTNSGHEIHKEQPQLVIDAIREDVEAVRSGSRQQER